MKKNWISILVVTVLLLSITPVSFVNASSEDTFAEKLYEMYDEIEIEYRPDVRWWLAEGLNTDETLIKNIQEIYDSGFGAAEFLAMPETGADSSVYGWGSDEWTADTKLIIEEATKLGLGFSLTSGTHWANANLPDTYTWNDEPYNPDNKAASKELNFSTIYLAPGEKYASSLPLPVSTGTYSSMGEYGAGASFGHAAYLFQGVIAAKLIEPRAEAGEEFDYTEGTGTGIIDMQSIVDLSGDVTQKDGEYYLDWIAPEDGDYALLTYWMHGTGQTAEPSVSTNYTVNYVDSYGIEAMIDYWEDVVLTEDLKETIRENGRGEIYMDSLELSTYGAGGIFWGLNFKNEFLNRRGYDITPYLPLITVLSGGFGSVSSYDYDVQGEENAAVAKKIRTDYVQTLTELYVENVLSPLQAWLHSLNMSLRAEPSYGMMFEISLPAVAIDGIETESFAQNADIDLYRGMLGSANMYNRLFSSETGAIVGQTYKLSMDYWTQLAYIQFVGGINRTVFHGYSAIEGSETDTYWPGHEGMYPIFSMRLNSRQPASVLYSQWTAMLARNQKVLRQGQPQRDIAILRTDYNFIHYSFPADRFSPHISATMYDETYFWKDLELQQSGYTYDYFSPQLLEDEENVSWTSDVLQPDGPSYQAMILYQDSLELSSAKKILEIANDGMPVLFVNNASESPTGTAPATQYEKAASTGKFLSDSDAELAAVVAQIKALPNVAEIDDESAALEALQQFDVYPRVGYDMPNNKILTISRLDPDNNIFYTFAYSYKFEVNKADAPYAFELVIDGEGKPYTLDDWTGEVSEIGVYDIRDGKTYIPLTLAVGEAAIIVLDLNDTGEAIHAVSTTAENVTIENGESSIRSTSSGIFQTTLSDGTVVESTIDVPAPIALDVWDIVIEDWNEGEKVVNVEEKFGHETREVYYTTKKTSLEFIDSNLLAWKDLPATSEQLALLTTSSGVEPSMEHVSGVGTYTTTFEIPNGFTDTYGAFLSIDSTGEGLTHVFINGQEVSPGIDLRNLKLDVSDFLMDGTNSIEIIVTSTLTNRMRERGYSVGWINNPFADDGGDPTPDVQAYGLQGDVLIVPYTIMPLN